MCGICGIISFEKPLNIDTLKTMTDLLSHRGPDDEGFHIGKNVGLGHRRLSIIDIETGKQPIYNEDKSLCIIFNGEIYNYRELRSYLIGKGHSFKTNSDTETILHLYEEKNLKSLNYLRGMFAFAIWNEKNRELFVANDRLGKKPVYYALNNNEFIFSSEMKSLLISDCIKRNIDYKSLFNLLTYNYISAPRTILSEIKKLEPGNYIIVKNNKISEKNKYWELKYLPKLKISEEDAIEKINFLLDDSVKVRLESEVPLGCLLSGGIDSSANVAYMSKYLTDVHTFTIGFEDEEFNEIPNARLIAEKFGTKHNELIIKPNAIEVLPDLVWHLDEPFGDSSSLATYFVSKIAKKFVSVVLNGDGGDESFFGYTRYSNKFELDTMYKWKKIPIDIRKKIIKPLSEFLFRLKPNSRITERLLLGNNFSILSGCKLYSHSMKLFKLEQLKQVLDPHCFNLIKDEIHNETLLNILNEEKKLSYSEKIIRADNKTYLPYDLLIKMDRMSMANSLETRSPFLDHRLMEFVATLPVDLKFKNFHLKYLLKKVMRNILPDRILYGPKKGFSVPIKKWFRNELNIFAKEILLSQKSAERKIFNSNYIKRLFEEHESKIHNYHSEIWTLLNIELWFRTFIDKRDVRPIKF